MNLSGGNKNVRYFFSVGYNKDQEALVGNNNNKLSLRSDNTFLPFKKMQVRIGAGYTHTKTGFNSPGRYSDFRVGNKKLPLYSRLVNDDGSPADIDYELRGAFTDTVGSGKLLDWKYRPLQELAEQDESIKTNAFIADVDLKYQFSKNFSAEVKYQYQNATDLTALNNNVNTYYARDLINDFTQIGNNAVTYIVPKNAIREESKAHLNHHALRAQLNYSHTWSGSNRLSAIAGTEVRDVSTYTTGGRVYAGVVDYSQTYPILTSSSPAKIPGYTTTSGKYVTRFVSWYGNASYDFLNRYVITASARKDASNLFGTRSNEKGVPLWSLGLAWKTSNEDFYKSGLLPYLNFRLTYGYSGNVNNSISALTTILANSPSPFTNVSNSSIYNLPNSLLRWEKIRQINAAIDFSTKKDRVKGSIEYYSKRATDVLAGKPLDPTLGTFGLITNSADVEGSGIDVQLFTRNINAGRFKWNSLVVFNQAAYKVKSFFYDADNGFTSEGIDITPIRDYNPYLLVSFRWAGLDPATGDPVGYLDKALSKDYEAIVSQTPFSDQYVSGPALPKYFGNVTNTFSWKGISVSFNVLYRFGYYFRRPTLNYSSGANLRLNPDYLKRWKRPGDEKFTNVPSSNFSVNDVYKYNFYSNSEVTVEKGGNIRLNDIRIDYTVNKIKVFRKLIPIKECEFYVFVNDINFFVWRASKAGLDPDYPLGLKPILNITTGLKINL
ncbi:MAG: hypothetical protein H7Y03_03960 [Chitinophagaceae bacterium]|nr:hypothetical protein [Chitinophagaceae bacterium]